VAQTRTRGLSFELLESRTLLNVAFTPAPFFPSGPPSDQRAFASGGFGDTALSYSGFGPLPAHFGANKQDGLPTTNIQFSAIQVITQPGPDAAPPALAIRQPPLVSSVPQGPQSKSLANNVSPPRDQPPVQGPAQPGPLASIGQQRIDLRPQDRAVAMSASNQLAGAIAEPLAVPGKPAKPLVSKATEFASSPPSMVLANIPPLDVRALQFSIKDFFDQIDKLGITLSEKQINLLYGLGIMAVATVLALELVRRQARPAPPALAPGQGSIPYSER
jgi:hypothetical protein